MIDLIVSPAPCSFADEDITAQAAKAAAERDHFWFGDSGLPVTGDEIVAYLAEVRALLEKRGWEEHRTSTEAADEEFPEFPEIDETASTKTLLLSGLRFLREWYVTAIRDAMTPYTPGPLSLSSAMYEVERASWGADVERVATNVLLALIRARTGSTHVYAVSPWADRKGRTWDEVVDLLDAAASFAWEHGPRA